MSINTTYQFVTNGDFIDFYVNNNLATSLSKDSNAIQWYFDNDPGIRFCVRGGTYFTRQPEDISFDATPLVTKEDFVVAIKSIFPVYAGGSGSTPGIDDVLAEAQALTANRTIDLNGKFLRVREGGEDYLLIHPASGTLTIGGHNGGIHFVLQGTAGAADAAFELMADYNDGTNRANIVGYADATTKTLAYTADTHTVVGKKSILAIDELESHTKVHDGVRTVIDLDVDDLVAKMGDVVNEGNGTLLTVDDVLFKAILKAIHVNVPSIQNFANNAAAITGGLAVGDLYRTLGIVNVVI